MAKQPNENDLQNFVLHFDKKVVAPLTQAGFVRNKFNVFDILNIERQELRHSDFLAFLLSPTRSGEVGRQFLPTFLSLVAKEHPTLGLNFFQMFYGNFDKVIVKREYKNIDILLDINLAGKDYVVIIENKVDSGEQIYDAHEFKGQLAKYQATAAKDYPQHKPILLFLSPDKRKATENGWCAIDYRLVYTALSMVNLETVDNTIKILINDYLKLLKGQFKMETDEKLKMAALNIYRGNKDIFNFIFENLPNRTDTAAEIIYQYLSTKNGITLKSTRPCKFPEFSIDEISNIRNDLQIVFQINADELSIWAYTQSVNDDARKLLDVPLKKATVTVAKTEYLAQNDKDKTNVIINNIDSALLDNDIENVKHFLVELLDNAFAENGYVQKHTKHLLALLSENKKGETK